MNEQVKRIQMKSGNKYMAVEWTHKEKPAINTWYLAKQDDRDYWKIVKDFYSAETKITYYKIVEYYNSDVLYTGYTLGQVREIMRENTYRMVI